jgi:hypothetical protein
MCHTYHAAPSLAAAENSSAGGNAFKQMLLGKALDAVFTFHSATQNHETQLEGNRGLTK